MDDTFFAEAVKDGKMKVETDVDKLKMEDKGQYIYVSVATEDQIAASEQLEPLVKFNNGFDGGSSEVLFNEEYQKDPKGVLHALFRDKLEPAIRGALP
mmetsp:Transcript_28094/g.77329  ORF Transcript_28094/g.77329 Transcript_28094/m.77329 type:complete len:98 (-) Transcript_28094:55-348(-)